ncbi:hypothetical protein GEV01_21530 [Rugamonas sp. FT103W]|uniref:Uncharacterized protein n=1 Tax=Rugamonas rivuli TaxID=2743358 RepID=A0A843SJ47_9BURK|nr:hypothetical protein [Rugamonas rivuli]
MTDVTHPTKESVRKYLERRTQQPCEPPPTPEEIRRQLGWHVLPAASAKFCGPLADAALHRANVACHDKGCWNAN